MQSNIIGKKKGDFSILIFLRKATDLIGLKREFYKIAHHEIASSSKLMMKKMEELDMTIFNEFEKDVISQDIEIIKLIDEMMVKFENILVPGLDKVNYMKFVDRMDKKLHSLIDKRRRTFQRSEGKFEMYEKSLSTIKSCDTIDNVDDLIFVTNTFLNSMDPIVVDETKQLDPESRFKGKGNIKTSYSHKKRSYHRKNDKRVRVRR